MRVIAIMGAVPYWGIQSGPVIYRHLLRLARSHEVICATYDTSRPEAYPFRIYQLLQREKWWPPVRAWMPGSHELRLHLLARKMGRELGIASSDRILICLHTREHQLAQVLSAQYGTPIVAMLHDLWSDGEHGHILRAIRKCASILPVSDGLKELVTAHGAKRVERLLPIGEEFIGNGRSPPGRELTVGIAGSMDPDYIEAAERIGDRVIAIGATSEMTRSDKVHVIPRFEKNSDALSYLASNCDALIVYQTFDEAAAHIRYSFPSRLVDFAQTGLPLVTVGPRTSSLGVWSSACNWPLWLENPHDTERIEAVRARLLHSADWKRFSMRTVELARSEFSPMKIHEVLERALLTADLAASEPEGVLGPADSFRDARS